MRVNARKAGSLALTAALLAVCTLLSGCNQEPEQKPTPTPPSVVQKQREVIEMMPSNSEESLRRHIFDANGFEVETRIEYRNGDKAITKLRTDGTESAFQRVKKDGTVVVEKRFAADGKTMVGGHELRDDGTMKVKVTQDADGTIRSVTYWYDGKSVFSEKTQAKTGAYENTFYRKNGKLWVKRSGSTAGVIDTEKAYNDAGQLESSKEKAPGGGQAITYYRTDGTAKYRQYVVEKANYYNYVNRTITHVDEFGSDGKTVVRTFFMSSDGWSLDRIERPNADGSKTVRWVQYDETVTREETQDAGGKVTGTKTYSSSDNVKESFDRSTLREPYNGSDPTSTWDMQERYPSYRTP